MSDIQFYVQSRWGGSEDAPTAERMRELIAEFSIRDEEHPDAWLTYCPTEWTLRLDEDQYAYLEGPQCGTIAHMQGVSATHALQLWIRFANGGREAVKDEEWTNGPRYVSPEEFSERQVRADQLTLELDRAFYNKLGPEQPETSCKSAGCTRGRIAYSVFCRVHHFEQIQKRQCPFGD